MRSKGPILLALLCLALGLVAYSGKNHLPGAIVSRYVLTKPDGTQVRSRAIRTDTSHSSEGILQLWEEELADASGAVRFTACIGSDIIVEIEGALVDGKCEGLFRTFISAEDRRIQAMDQEFLHDRKHGRSISYFPDGTVMIEGGWREGLRNGRWTFNALKFKPAMTLSYADDLLHGELKIYNSMGAAIVCGQYDQGKPVTGTFIENPWQILEATRYEKFFETALLHFRNGERMDITSITIETGR